MQTDLISLLLIILILGILIFGGAGAFSLFLTFTREKGKTIPTREDLAGISEKIDRLEQHYASQFEQIRSQAENDTQLKPAQHEMEIANLSELWLVLLDLQQASLGLKPVLDRLDPEIPPEKIYELQLRIFVQALQSLSNLLHRKRPFYPKEIFDPLIEIMTTADTGRFKHQPTDVGEQQDLLAHWDGAVTNADDIILKIDNICELIRARLTT